MGSRYSLQCNDFSHILRNVIKKKKSGRRSDDNVKVYLAECFNKGEVSEQKASAKDAVDAMKYKKIQMESRYSLQTSDFSHILRNVIKKKNLVEDR